MLRKLVVGLALVAGFGLVVGCEETKKASEKGKDAGDKIKDLSEKAKESAEKAGEKAKEAGAKVGEKAKEVGEKATEAGEKAVKAGKDAVVKSVSDAMPKIEEKIKDLSGDKLQQATAKLKELKSLLEDFKTSDAASWEASKEKLMKVFEELKKMVGL